MAFPEPTWREKMALESLERLAWIHCQSYRHPAPAHRLIEPANADLDGDSLWQSFWLNFSID
jgi:hypothetical protein